MLGFSGFQGGSYDAGDRNRPECKPFFPGLVRDILYIVNSILFSIVPVLPPNISRSHAGQCPSALRPILFLFFGGDQP